MEDALKLELIGLGTRFFNGMKNYWTPQDLAEIYSLYNRINGTNESDSGCPSCRRAKINSLRDQYMQLIKE